MSNYREVWGNMPNQFRASTNGIAWSHEDVRIGANSLVTVHFDTTKPNMFMMQNPNDTVIHVGISRIPTASNYEFKVSANNSATFGRPTQTDVLYLLNKGNAEVVVSLFSVHDTFDMAILQNTSIDVSKISAFDGIINGFGKNVSLPSGSNKIGSVEIATNTFTTSVLERLLACVDALEILKNSGGNGENKTLRLPDSRVIEGSSVVCDYSNQNVNHIVFIANDGDSDVYVTITPKAGHGQAFSITLKAGEVINDLSMEISNITFTSIDGANCRMLCGEMM